jgi:single-strand DNA-binding protein
MPNFNRITIIGHLGKDPESRTTPGDKYVASFSVAVSEKWTGGEHTEWFNIVAWGKLGETCFKYLHKGSAVMIEGKLRTREYDANDGTKRKVVEIIASNMLMLDSRKAAAEQEEIPF